MTGLSPRRRPGTWVVVADPGDDVPCAAMIAEDEGRCLVIAVEAAEARGLPTEPRLAWLTIGADTTLEQVGVTATFSVALAARGIACNVLAGLHHDHLLVPEERAAEAIGVLGGLTLP
jgi:uncharacterized protein